jgi:hypothetical protein
MRRAAAGGEDLDGYRAAAERRVRECYDWEEVVSRYEELFYRLAGASGRAA